VSSHGTVRQGTAQSPPSRDHGATRQWRRPAQVGPTCISSDVAEPRPTLRPRGYARRPAEGGDHPTGRPAKRPPGCTGKPGNRPLTVATPTVGGTYVSRFGFVEGAGMGPQADLVDHHRRHGDGVAARPGPGGRLRAALRFRTLRVGGDLRGAGDRPPDPRPTSLDPDSPWTARRGESRSLRDRAGSRGRYGREPVDVVRPPDGESPGSRSGRIWRVVRRRPAGHHGRALVARRRMMSRRFHLGETSAPRRRAIGVLTTGYGPRETAPCGGAGSRFTPYRFAGAGTGCRPPATRPRSPQTHPRRERPLPPEPGAAAPASPPGWAPSGC
jgi:hypothetical protein